MIFSHGESILLAIIYKHHSSQTHEEWKPGDILLSKDSLNVGGRKVGEKEGKKTLIDLFIHNPL